MLSSIIPWSNRINLGGAEWDPSSIDISWPHKDAGNLATGQSSGVQACLGDSFLGSRGKIHSWSHSKPHVLQTSAGCTFSVCRCTSHGCLSQTLSPLRTGSLRLNFQAKIAGGSVAQMPFADRHWDDNAQTTTCSNFLLGWQTNPFLPLSGQSTLRSAGTVFTL